MHRFSALGADSKLVTALFRSFIQSILVYCITILYSHLYSNDKKAIKSFDKRAQFYGAKLNCDVANRVLELGWLHSLRIFHDNDHFIHNVLEKMPSGRIRSRKGHTKVTQSLSSHWERLFLRPTDWVHKWCNFLVLLSSALHYLFL